MTLTLKTTKGKCPTVTIQHAGYFPATFVCYGRRLGGKRELDIRLIHGVAFKGDHDAAMAAFNKNEPPFATSFPMHGLERPEG